MVCEIAASLSLVLWAMTSAIGAEAANLVYVEGSTMKVCQLSGDLDRPEGKPTLSQTGKRFGVIATDLGSSFEHKGRLYFLFGDTWGRPGARDVLAWTTSNDPEAILLDFHRAPDGKWLPLAVPGVRLGPFEIPSYGVSIGGDIYVVFTTDHSTEKTMGRSVVARSEWSDGLVIFNPWRDKGYGHFIHFPARFRGNRDAFHDPQREAEWGGEYGPYILSRFTTGTAEQCRVYYTMSTWNPYQVVVMRSDLRPNSPGPGRRTSGLPKSGSRR